MNLPNKLTLIRVLMIPVFVLLYLLSGGTGWLKYVSVLIYIAASVTDIFDGRIARKYNLVTNFGKFMDPLADKLLVCSALICLIGFNLIPSWIVVIIVAREFAISGFRLLAAEQGLVLAASKMAKIKTNVQIVMTVVLMLDFKPLFFVVLGQILILAALILTIASLTEYIIKNRQILKGDI